MAIKQVDGSSVTLTPYGAVAEANNNNGTMKANGVSENLNVSAVTLESEGVFGSTVVDNDWADKAVDGGVFAHNHSGPISSLVTTELAGLENTAILSPGNNGDTIRSINKTEDNHSALFTTALRANKYNRVTNEWEAGYPSGVVIQFASDNAANPSRDVPGELTYIVGGSPVNDNYKPKTN